MFGYGGILVILLALFIWLVFFHGFTKIDDYVLSRYFPKKRKFTFGNEEEEEAMEVEDDLDETKSTSLADMILDKIKPQQKVESSSTINEKEVVFQPSSLAKEPFKGGNIAFTVEAPEEEKPSDADTKESALSKIQIEEDSDELLKEFGEYDPKLDLSNYQYPPLSLLQEYGNNGPKVSNEELEANKNKIVETINNFAIGIASIKATIGPTVTLYEIVPEAAAAWED